MAAVQPLGSRTVANTSKFSCDSWERRNPSSIVLNPSLTFRFPEIFFLIRPAGLLLIKPLLLSIPLSMVRVVQLLVLVHLAVIEVFVSTSNKSVRQDFLPPLKSLLLGRNPVFLSIHGGTRSTSFDGTDQRAWLTTSLLLVTHLIHSSFRAV